MQILQRSHPWGDVVRNAAPAQAFSPPRQRREESLAARARAAASEVVDPEIPVLTISDLGVLREVSIEGDRVVVTITPTYSGCPAMNMIALEISLALERAGIAGAEVRTVLAPAWTTEWLSEEGRRKLLAYGIAPPVDRRRPARTLRRRGGGLSAMRLGTETERLAEFGSTSCKALWRCRACREPFDYFRCH